MFVDGFFERRNGWLSGACSSQLRIMQPKAGEFVCEYVPVCVCVDRRAQPILHNIHTGSLCIKVSIEVYINNIHICIDKQRLRAYYGRRKIIKRSRFNFIALLSFLDLLLRSALGVYGRSCMRSGAADVMACLAAFAGFFMYNYRSRKAPQVRGAYFSRILCKYIVVFCACYLYSTCIIRIYVSQ